MLLFIISFILIKQVHGDMAPVEYMIQPDNVLDEDNIIITLLWALSMGSCIGLVCKHKKMLPIEINEIKPYWDYPCYDKDKRYYEVKVKEGNSLKELQTSLQDVKSVLNKLENIKKEQKHIEFKENNGIITEISDEIIYKYGEGPIRFKENGKYYHGYGLNKSKWNKDYSFRNIFFEYNQGKKLLNKKWGTYDACKFCCNSECDHEGSKRKRTHRHFICNGHV